MGLAPIGSNTQIEKAFFVETLKGRGRGGRG